MPNEPKLNPARRNPRVGPLKLPANGYQGPIPAWPLSDEATPAESVAWTELWRTPHAHAWSKLGWVRTVARYCRVMIEAERPSAMAGDMAEARQLEDRLGLTPRAMRSMLWEIAPDEVEEQRQASSGGRNRVKAV